MRKTNFDLYLEKQISRIESPAYEGHSLSMLRRVARALNAEVSVRIEPVGKPALIAEMREKYGSRE